MHTTNLSRSARPKLAARRIRTARTISRRAAGARDCEGFTLVEALIVMTILGVLVSSAMPAFAEFGRTQRIRAASFDLVADLMLARSEAIKRSSAVTIVGQGAGWRDGWTIRVDGGVHAGLVVQRHDSPGPEVTLAAPATLGFDRNGRLAGGGTARLGITDTVANEVKRCIEVDLSGLPQSRVGGCT
jgi:type IV fimbrial biogenesis protein FimT